MQERRIVLVSVVMLHSHSFSSSRIAVDLEWKKFLVKLVRQKGTSVLPVYFSGQNSTSFQIASHIHSNIRLALLLKELDRLKGKSLNFTVGNPISPEEIINIPRGNILPYLKDRTFALRHQI